MEKTFVCPVCCSVSAVSLQEHRLGRCGCWIEVPFVGTTQFGHQHCQERREQNPRCSLTLSAHAQRGLQYLVCQSFRPSVRYHLFWHYAQQGGQEAIPTGSVPHWLDFLNSDFRKSTTFKSYGVKTKRTSQYANEHGSDSARFEHGGGSRNNTKGEYVVLACQKHYLPT